MSAGSNLTGLAPLGSKKIPPPRILPETAYNNDMTDFDMVPDRNSRGQEMLSPLAKGSTQMKTNSSLDMNPPNPLLKASFGRNPNPKKGIGLAPLGSRNLSNDFDGDNNNSNDPLLRSLKQKKKGLAPMGIAQINMGPEPSETYQSPMKFRGGANRIISPMAAAVKSKQTELPMHIMGVSRTNIAHTLRQPRGMGVPAPLSCKNSERKLLNIDGAFPDDDDNDSGNSKRTGFGGVNDFQRSLKDANMLMETGHRMKNMIAPEGAPSSFPRVSGDQSLRRSQRRARQQQEQEHDPWSTTSGTSYVY